MKKEKEAVSYLTTSANRSAAKRWLTRDTLRPTALAISLGLISLFSASACTMVKATGFPRRRQSRDYL